ncbi:MAG TPA: DNA repair protein RadA, partial [Oscillospiraceae bacterium]|nr:DNA repair protein RadA [Oscillospiraceae bacterium]
YSSLLDRPAGDDLIAFGEIGLGGEIRGVSRISQRIAEAQRLGFKRCIIPKQSLAGINPKNYSIEILAVSNLKQAFDVIA